MSTQAPSRTELVKNAAEIAPKLQSHALWAEENRRLHEEVIESMAAAGVFQLRTPARYGGHECDARTLVDVLTQLGHGDGSAAWNAAVWSISGWLACLFPDEVQDEVFATSDTRVCGVLSPTAMAVPAQDGMVLNGQWQFISGAWHSHWQVTLAMGPAPDGSQWPIMALVPLSDLEIVDDWHTAGLRGTGSVSTRADNVFVPQARIMPLVAVLSEQYATQRNVESPVYRSPMIATGCTTFTGPALGLARAAQASFLDRLADRKITYTNYLQQREAPITHFQVAEATMKTDEAEFHADRLARLVDDKGAGSQPWTVQDRAFARASLGRVFQLTKESASILKTASGGGSIYNHVPIQRIERDLQALNMHALMHPNTNFELYGRILCGLEPNTQYM